MGNQSYDGSNQQQPPRNNALPIIAVIVFVIVVVSVVAIALLVGTSGNGANSPQSALNNFVDEMNSGNIEGALSYTDAVFLSDEGYDELFEEMEWESEDAEYDVRQINVVDKEDMDDDFIEDIEDDIDEIEDHLHINVEDWCQIEFKIEITEDGDSETSDGELFCIKVDGRWYLAIYYSNNDYYDDEYMYAPAGSLMFDVQSSTSVKITFNTFTSIIEPMDIKVILTPSVGPAIELTFSSPPSSASTTMVATGGASAIYYDYNYQGNAINSGDYITVTGIAGSTSYTVAVYHYPSDSLCSLVGPIAFTTP